ncbi:MAG: SUMF1/EgtB/PvdO family nonheme iron enzyme [Planctomycetes bacterium]|nr:SUMF1/EgtB/PvdO family nonheme iron enzyme [Planctomycetota bacterium]
MAGTDDVLADLFTRAVALPVEAREAFVTAQCGDDPALAEELRALLRHDDSRTPAGLRTPLRRAAMPERIGPYRLIRSLGFGGMGEVFLGEQEAPVRRNVALKLIRAGMDSADVLARFAAERQVLAWLDHPCIAKVLDAGTAADGRPFFVMEFVDGPTLATFVREHRLDLAARLRLFMQTCRGVLHAHQRGVIHRDLKPSNVLVTCVDGELLPRIIDFGVAKAIGDERLHTPATLAGQVVGTPDYMAPEHLAGNAPPDVRGDVYSLGVMLFELLANRRPFPAVPGENFAQSVQRLTAAEPPPPSRVCAGELGSGVARRVQGELDWITAKALAKDPLRRYQSVQDLLADVQAYCSGLPIAAGPPTLAYRLTKLLRRHRVAVLAGSAVAAALAAGLLLALWQASAAATQASRAEHSLEQVNRLADERLAATLHDLSRHTLWPLVAERRAGLQQWLARCAELEARLPQHRADLAALRAQLGDAVGAVEADGAATLADLADPHNDSLRWRHGVLTRLVHSIERLLDDGARFGRRDVLQRLAKVDALVATQAASDAAWQDALAGIGDRVRSPKYGGWSLPRRQRDLVPLGQDAASGLWEFWHVPSGARPAWSDGRCVAPARPDDGIVLVLLPGGMFAMGADAGTDELAHDYEAPVHEVSLAPFFLAKHELTQAQVERWTGANPSWFAAGRSRGVRERANVGPTNPVEQVSWDAAATLVRQMGLELPTEAQWEYACRAGTRTRFFWGDDEARFGAFANIADEASSAFFRPGTKMAMGVDDGQGVHAPVGGYAPNGFGLHDMLGNIGEWCRDWSGRYHHPVAPGTGERQAEGDGRRTRIIRGGTFMLSPRDCRCSARGDGVVGEDKWTVGIRAARAIDD